MADQVIRTCPALDGVYPRIRVSDSAATSFTANLYDLTSASGALLSASAYTTGTEIIAAADGNTWTLNLGHANVIADWDALTAEGGHVLVELIPNAGTTQYAEVIANDAEHVRALYPSNTAFADASATAPATTFPYGSSTLPVGTCDQLATVMAARGYARGHLVGAFGTSGSRGPSTAGIGTAWTGAYLYSETTATIFPLASQIPVFSDAVFNRIGISCVNSGSGCGGPFTMQDATATVLSIYGTGSRSGQLTAISCEIVGGFTLQAGVGCWTAKLVDCFAASAATIQVNSMGSGTMALNECIGPFTWGSTGSIMSGKTINVVGHKGSPTLTIANTVHSSCNFALSGAIDSVVDNRTSPSGTTTLAKLSHLADLTGNVTTLAPGAVTATEAPNLDAAITSRATQAQILSDATPFPGASVTEARLAELDAANLPADVAGVATTAGNIETDTQDIQGRLPAALVAGRIDADVGAIQAGAVTAIQAGLSVFDSTTDAVIVGTNNDKTGYAMAGTLTSLDLLDTAQDAQHAATQAAIVTVDGNVDAILVDSTALVSRLTATRAGYIDNIGAGAVATAAALTASEGVITTRLDGIEGATFDTVTDSLEALRNNQGSGGLTAQETRDAMKLAPTAGAPAAGSVDEHLDTIEASGGGGSTIGPELILKAPALERPTASATEVYTVIAEIRNAGALADPVSSVVNVTCANGLGTDRSTNLGAATMTRIRAGQYSVTYSVAGTHAIEQIVFTLDFDFGATTYTFTETASVLDTSGTQPSLVLSGS